MIPPAPLYAGNRKDAASQSVFRATAVNRASRTLAVRAVERARIIGVGVA
ncbi:MAG TPA: hypothetical protein VNY05_43710 [Candidatus Acidoferrales bacterium]|nr:hypothetical protein [Candidatus Acidoferrales bacterium]